MTKIYVVSEVGYEYNDEIYHTTEGEYGEPVRGFTSKTAAENYALAKTIDKARDIHTDKWSDLSNYSYGSWDDQPASDSDEDLLAFLDKYDIEFYVVREIEFE